MASAEGKPSSFPSLPDCIAQSFTGTNEQVTQALMKLERNCKSPPERPHGLWDVPAFGDPCRNTRYIALHPETYHVGGFEDLSSIFPSKVSQASVTQGRTLEEISQRWMWIKQQISNGSSITEFLLLAFADTRELQLLHFWLFLGIYLAALLGNGLIITAVVCNHHLHSPMYFFFLNLSLLDLASISTTVPKAMANSLWDSKAISYMGCAAQVFLFVFFMSAEFSLLTIMSYDRYMAICKPLHYGTLVGSRACVHMAAAAWGSWFLYAVLHTANTFSIPLCQGNALDQFFCEIPQILKLSCSDAYLREVWVIVVSIFVDFVWFVFIVLSYVQIFRAVLKIPSEQGRHKAFSMCLPHLAVVSLFISTVMVAYLKPPSISSPLLDMVVAVLYSVVPPAVNPLIYSMRNQVLKDTFKKLIQSALSQQQ
ncbi:olfactory receptor 14A16-like [Mycteria americana]|uniref:olfactory receptor 14A16-like n=1 Tax=Mycteria americana TaxID=33587 RepID=UPI003F58CED0